MRTTTLLTASALLFACSGGTPKDIGRGLGSGARDAAEDAERSAQADSGEPGDPGEDVEMDASLAAEAGALVDAQPAPSDAARLDADPMDSAADAAARQVDASVDAGFDANAELDAADAANAEPDAADASQAADTSPDAPPPTGTLALALDFESALPANVNPGGGTLTPSQGYAPLGPPGNLFGPTFLRSQTANTVSITLSDLPAHSSLSLSFLFAAIDSLDGTGSFPAGDFFRIDLDGQTVFRESFANALESQIQSYDPPANVVLARRVDLGFAGPGSFYTDSAYDMGADPRFADLPHQGSSATLTFTLEGDGVQSLDDESWAIDNVRVTLGDTPRSSGDGGT